MIKTIGGAHGWQFAAAGAGQLVPALPDFKPPASHIACTHEAHEALTGPYTAQLTKLPQSQMSYQDVIGLFVCPIEAERSRVGFRVALTDFDSSDDELRQFQPTIFMQDRPVLESQSPKLLPIRPQRSSGEVHSAADRSSTNYRRFLSERGISFGVC